MGILKPIIFPTLAVGSVAVLWLVMNRPWEKRFLKAAIIGSICAKLIGSVLVYAIRPSLIQYSDARSFYLPQTLHLLSGKIPNRDFASPYSVLFTPFLAIPVKLWPSPGSIALTMILAETAMLYIYLMRCRKRTGEGGWRVAFLYAFSPFSCYWIALSGHNSALIALWIVIGLVMAERGKAMLSGIVGAFMFLTTKILALLAWPGLVLYDREKRMVRIVPMILSLVAVAGLSFAGIDSLSPLQGEMGASTNGNAWRIMGMIIPGLRDRAVRPFFPIMAFVVLFTPMCIMFMKANDSRDRFDRAAAFIAATFLLFLVVSNKGYSNYLIMTLLVVIHTVLRSARRLVVHMLPLVFLGSIGFIEESHGDDLVKLFLVDGLRIISYIYLLVFCFAASIRGPAVSPMRSSLLLALVQENS